MTAITESRAIIQIEETRAQAAVSESTMTRMGAMNNFLALREFTQHDFNINGVYNLVTLPCIALDGFVTYPFAFEIFDVIIYSGSGIGSSGTTELDLKWKPENSGVFASIFTTTPKFNSGAAASSSARLGNAQTGFTSPILSKSTFAAYDTLRFDLLSAMVGDVDGAYLKIFIRPI